MDRKTIKKKFLIATIIWALIVLLFSLFDYLYLQYYLSEAKNKILLFGSINISIWILGVLIIYYFRKKVILKEEKRSKINRELELTIQKLEEQIKSKTSEITSAQKLLQNKNNKINKLETILEKTNKILNESQVVVFRWRNEPTWPVEYVTENVQTIFGYSAKEFMTGKILYSDIISKKDIEQVSNEVKENSDNKSVLKFVHKNYRIKTKSGKVIWVEDRTNIIRKSDGTITFYEGIIIDVTDRKKIEEENQFKTEFEMKIASISTYFVNLQLKDIRKALSFTAQSFGRFFNIERAYTLLINNENEFELVSEYLQKNVLSLTENNAFLKISNFNWLHFSLLRGKPIIIENTERLSSSAEHEKKLMNTLGIKSFVALPIVINRTLYGFLGFDSNIKYGTLSKKYFPLFKLLTEVITNLYSKYLSDLELIDITDKNRSLIKAVEQSADSVVITDIQGNIEYVNPKFVELTGYSAEEVIGKNPRILKSGNTSAAEYKNLWDTILNGKVWKGQFKNIGKTGNVFWEKATISPIKNDAGKLTHFLEIKEDITEKILVENQRLLSQKMESIGQLAAGIAHEINTPMQYVGDNANFLADSYSAMTKVFMDFNTFLENENDYSSKEIREFYQNKKEEMDLDFIFEEVPEALEQTKIGIHRVTKIVRAMKDFAHPGSKEKAYFNLNNGLQNTVTISKNEWKYVAEIELKLDENLKEILCLQDELNQVFLNIIVNSSHAISEKNQKNNRDELGKIIIETKKEDETAVIKISDSGNGIKKSIIDKVFDPFFTTKDVGKGTGQGLAIVHDIIANKHKGKISVESEEGIGTTFIIELPINGLKEETK